MACVEREEMKMQHEQELVSPIMKHKWSFTPCAEETGMIWENPVD